MGAGYTILNDLAIASNYLVNGGLSGNLITDVYKVLEQVAQYLQYSFHKNFADFI